jgi:hypothetical protein
VSLAAAQGYATTDREEGEECFMAKDFSQDYETYKEIMKDLLAPIAGTGLDQDTLKRLYESKLVYLKNLRVKAFQEINTRAGGPSHFSMRDYELILNALKLTERHLHDLIILAVSHSLQTRQMV